MAIAQKLAGYSLGDADLLRRAMGKKKKEILDKEYVPFSDGMRAQRLLRRGDQDAVGHPGPVLRLRVQQGAHRRRTAWSRTGPRTSRPTTRPSTWRRCSPASATTRTSRRSTWPSAAGWASRCCRRTSTRRSARFTPVGEDIRFGLAAVRNVGANVVESIMRDPQGEGRVHRLLRLPAQGRRGGLQQEDRRVADQGGRVRLARAHPRGPARRARRRDRLVPRRQAQRGGRPVRPVRRRVRRRPTPAAAASWSRRRSRPASGTRPTCSPSSGRCSASTSPTTRCSASSTCWPRRADMSIAALTEEGAVADGQVRQPRRHPLRRAAPDHQAGPGLGVGHAGGPRRRGRGAVLPQHLRAGRAVHRRGRDRRGARAGSTGATTSPG